MEQTNQLTKKLTVKSLFSQEEVKKKFQELLGKRASSFMTSVLQIVSQNEMLKDCDPMSVYQSASVAATLDLPLNDNLGFAYIVPYNKKQKDGSYKKIAQFQMGYKGFIQLAQRTGLFKSIYASAIFQNQIVSENPLEGYAFDFTKKGDALAGYAAKFKLLNGYEATFYMTVEQLKGHGVRYSKTFTNKNGLWTTDFEAMATKTVLKLLLSKFAPLSIEMQRAVITDQALINDNDTLDVSYVDNEEVPIDKEAERLNIMIDEALTVEELTKLEPHINSPEQQVVYNQKFQELFPPQ